MTTELWRLSACELAARIARRETSARAATESVLARIEAVNPIYNALAHVSTESALQAAAAADAAQAEGRPLGALHGVPVTIKGSP